MSDDKYTMVPYFVYEGEIARYERHMKRMIIALMVSVAMIFASNLAWLIAWCQYDYTSEEIMLKSDDGGNANYIGEDGDIYNGTSESTPKDAQEERV